MQNTEIQNLKSQVEKLKKEVQKYKYDSLTGLCRRGDFQTRLEEMWYEYNEFGHRFIAAMIDIDGLHNLNRTAGGLEAGDELIKSVVNQIKENFEDSNIFRWGGDEFVILKRGNYHNEFKKRLNLINNSTVASVQIDSSVVNNILCEQDIINFIDESIIKQKSKNKRREHD